MPSYLQKTGHIDGRLPAPEIVAAAADLTRHMLNADPKRLKHSEAVARRADLSPSRRPVVRTAFGRRCLGTRHRYAPALRDTGFHPIDSARYLQSIGWPPALCNLVAHHSGARFVARVLKLDRELNAYPFSQDAVSDALTVADQTIGLHGEQVTLEERMSDMLHRHGPYIS
jgi:hypothetical protein